MFLLLRKPPDRVKNDKMSPLFLIVRVQPASVETQTELPLRSRRHLVGGRRVRFLLLGIHGSKPVVAVPVRANIGGDDVSQRVETIGEKVPITAICPKEILQELIVLWRP